MKKFLTLVLVLAMVFCLTSCQYLPDSLQSMIDTVMGSIFGENPTCEHDWMDATCTLPKTCSVCGVTEGDPIGHTEETIAGTAATCTESGKTEGKKCSACGEITVQQTVIEALGHTEEIITGTPATCTENGLSDGKKCTTCGDTTVAQKVIPANGHVDKDKNYICDDCDAKLCTNHIEEVVAGKDANCTETGLTDGKKCSVCGEVLIKQAEIPAKGHADADKNHACDNECDVYQGTHEDSDKNHKCDYGCSVAIGECKDEDKDHICDYGCGKAFGTHEDSNKDHACDYGCSEVIGKCEDIDSDHKCDHGCDKTFGAHEDSDKDHKCDYGCSVAIGEHADSATDNDHVCDHGCGATLEGCTGGSTVIENTVEADCENDGSYDEVVYCSICNKELSRTQKTIPAEGHTDNNKDNKCDVDGCNAILCGMDNHIEETVSGKSATCTADGLTEGKRCSACGEILVAQETIPAIGHSYESTVTTAPGCETTGVKTYTCKNDASHTYEEEIPATGHSYESSVTNPTCEGNGYTTHTCACGHSYTSDTIGATGHKDADKDHVCDNECGIYQGVHEDADKDHECDYGCSVAIGKCNDENKDHACDYGCDKRYGTHEDSDKDHECDYGCSVAFGAHEDNNKDHKCDYSCSVAIGECNDENKDHACDYGCDKKFGTHEDSGKDHKCDYGCSVAIGECKDEDKDHTCDYGCGKVFGTHEDSNKDHACDYGCSEVIGKCEDIDSDHKCDHGCGKAFGTHEDSGKDHKCDYGCSVAIGECKDEDKNHTCDYGCGKAFGTHEDSNKDHECDYGCSEVIGECNDENKDHACDYGCAEAFGTHEDTDNDHVCDYGCGATLEACTGGSPVTENTKEADCENDGSYDEVVYCSICNKELSRTQKTIPAKGHNAAEDDGDCTTAIKCTNKGCEYIFVVAKSHTSEADDGDCTTAVKCANAGCEYIFVDAKSHTPEADDGDVTTAVKCTNEGCGQNVVPAKEAITLVIPTFENGSVVADKKNYAVGDTVTLTVSANKNYAQKLYINGAPILVNTNGKYSFVAEEGKSYNITGEFVSTQGKWYWTAEYGVLNQAHGVFHAPATSEKNGELVPTADKCYGGQVLVKDPSHGTKKDFAIVLKMQFSDGQKAEVRLVNKDGNGHYMVQSMSGMFGSWKWYYDLNDEENAAVANGEGVWFGLVRYGTDIELSVNGKVLPHRADTPISLAEDTVLNQFKVTTFNFSYAIDVPYEFFILPNQLAIGKFVNGTVTTDKDSYKVGDTVTLTVSPAKDYAQKLYINGEPILVDTNGKYSFVIEEGKVYNISGEFVYVKGAWYWTAEYGVLNQAHGVFHSPVPAGGEKNGELVPTANKCYGGKVLVKDPSGGTKQDFAIVLKMQFSDGQKAEIRLVNKDGKGHYMVQSMSGMFGSWKWYYDLNDEENAAVANGEGVWFELVRNGSNIDIKINGKVLPHRADTPISLAESTVLNQFKVTTFNFSYAIDVKYEFYMTK